jgi:hypothetical protein
MLDAPIRVLRKQSRLVRTLTFNRPEWGGDPTQKAATNARAQSWPSSLVMSLTDAFASPNSIAVFGS